MLLPIPTPSPPFWYFLQLLPNKPLALELLSQGELLEKQLHSGAQVHCEEQPGITWGHTWGRSGNRTHFEFSHLSQQQYPGEGMPRPPSSMWKWSSRDRGRTVLVTLLPSSWDDHPYAYNTCSFHFATHFSPSAPNHCQGTRSLVL